jgi:hypothetical protein
VVLVRSTLISLVVLLDIVLIPEYLVAAICSRGKIRMVTMDVQYGGPKDCKHSEEPSAALEGHDKEQAEYHILHQPVVTGM